MTGSNLNGFYIHIHATVWLICMSFNSCTEHLRVCIAGPGHCTRQVWLPVQIKLVTVSSLVVICELEYSCVTHQDHFSNNSCFWLYFKACGFCTCCLEYTWDAIARRIELRRKHQNEQGILKYHTYTQHKIALHSEFKMQLNANPSFYKTSYGIFKIHTELRGPYFLRVSSKRF